MKRIALTVATFALLTGTAFAQSPGGNYGYEKGGVKINAEVHTNVQADNHNIAEGQKARAFQSIATIHGGSEINYDVELNVTSGENVNAAKGDEALACQAVGSIGEFPACREAYHAEKY